MNTSLLALRQALERANEDANKAFECLEDPEMVFEYLDAVKGALKDAGSALDNLVAPAHGCPDCGERDVDRLIWMGGAKRPDFVRCASCGREYVPGQGDDNANNQPSHS